MDVVVDVAGDDEDDDCAVADADAAADDGVAGVDDVAGDVTDAAYAEVDIAFVVVDDENAADVDVVVIEVVPSVAVGGVVERLIPAGAMYRR